MRGPQYIGWKRWDGGWILGTQNNNLLEVKLWEIWASSYLIVTIHNLRVTGPVTPYILVGCDQSRFAREKCDHKFGSRYVKGQLTTRKNDGVY